MWPLTTILPKGGLTVTLVVNLCTRTALMSSIGLVAYEYPIHCGESINNFPLGPQ